MRFLSKKIAVKKIDSYILMPSRYRVYSQWSGTIDVFSRSFAPLRLNPYLEVLTDPNKNLSEKEKRTKKLQPVKVKPLWLTYIKYLHHVLNWIFWIDEVLSSQEKKDEKNLLGTSYSDKEFLKKVTIFFFTCFDFDNKIEVRRGEQLFMRILFCQTKNSWYNRI